jgi:hypothetical protein
MRRRRRKRVIGRSIQKDFCGRRERRRGRGASRRRRL